MNASPSSPMQSLKRALVYLKAYRWMSLGAILSLLFFIAANAITPQLFRWGIDEGIAKKDLQVVFLVGGLLVAKLARRKSFAFGRKDIVQANQKQCLEHSTTHTKKRSHLNSSCEEDSL